MPERQIWFNFRETTLTYEKSCRPTQLHAPKRGKTPARAGGESISVVFSAMVREDCATRSGKYDLSAKGRSIKRADNFEVSPDW